MHSSGFVCGLHGGVCEDSADEVNEFDELSIIGCAFCTATEVLLMGGEFGALISLDSRLVFLTRILLIKTA